MAGKKATVDATNEEINAMIAGNSSEALASVLDLASDGTRSAREAAFNELKSAYGGTLLNEYISTLMNMVGDTYIQMKRKWNSPLRELYRDRIQDGDTIEEIAVNMFQRHSFQSKNFSPGDCFKVSPPDAVAMFHTINHENRYDLTLNYVELQKAFLNNGGLSKFVMRSLTQLQNSAEYDDFRDMVRVVEKSYMFRKMRAVKIDDPLASKENAENMVQKIRETVLKMSFPTSDYNVAGIKTNTPIEDIVVLITPAIEANQVVKVLSAAFNREDAEFLGRVIVIDKFEKTNISAVICDRDTFMCFPKLYETHSIYDPKSLNLNIYLHDHGIYSASDFTSSYVLTTDKQGDSAITEVTVGSATETVAKGGTDQMTATVTGGTENEVFWEVTGSKAATLGNTYVSDSGMLYVDGYELTGTKLIVTAVSKYNREVKGSHTVTVE